GADMREVSCLVRGAAHRVIGSLLVEQEVMHGNDPTTPPSPWPSPQSGEGVANNGEGVALGAYPFPFATASAMRSGLIGSSVRRAPVASWIALPMAAGAGMMGGSPTPRAPNGPDGDGTSTMIVSRSGRSAAVSFR